MMRALDRLARLVCLAALAASAAATAQDRAAAAPPAAEVRTGMVRMPDGRLLASDIARIVTRGELVVSMANEDNPPFFSLNQKGELVGTDVDLSKLIAAELRVPVRFDRSAMNFDAVAETVAAGKADLGISRLTRTLKRGQMVQFSSTYMRLGHALLINRIRFAELAGDQPVSQVVRNFTGTISVIANSSWEEFGRRNFPNAKLVRFPTWAEAVNAAKTGMVVAAYRDEMAVLQIVNQDPGLALTMRTVTFNDLESPLSVMVGVGDATLLSFVNEVIAQRADKPTVSSILKSTKK